VQIVDTESFDSTFGPKATRKRPRLNGSASLSDLAGAAMSTQESYNEKKLEQAPDDGKGVDWIQLAREAVLSKGQSKRIWNELYKVQKRPLKIPDYRSLTRLMWS
jgi:nuclear GTP-binding protein